MQTRLAIFALALGGCSLVYSDTLDKKQCESAADCNAAGSNALQCIDNVCQQTGAATQCAGDVECGDGKRCGFDGLCYETWACLDTPDDFPTPSAPFHVKTLLRRLDKLTDPTAVGDVTVIACSPEVPDCTDTDEARAAAITLDANKQLDLTITTTSARGFDGVVRILPKDMNAYLPTYLHALAASPWAGEYVTEKQTNPATTGLLSLLKTIVTGVTLDPDGVLAGAYIYDCGGRPAVGVQVVPVGSPNAKFIPIAQGNLPNTASMVTDDYGAGFVVNLPSGKLQSFDLLLPASATAAERKLATLSLVVQPGGVNFFSWYPRYSGVQAWMREYARRTAGTTTDGGI